MVKINLALREQICQKIGSERVNEKLKLFKDYSRTFTYTLYKILQTNLVYVDNKVLEVIKRIMLTVDMVIMPGGLFCDHGTKMLRIFAIFAIQNYMPSYMYMCQGVISM